MSSTNNKFSSCQNYDICPNKHDSNQNTCTTNTNTNSTTSEIPQNFPKNIFLLWLQGWSNANWINRQVAESWEINNPDWNIHYIDLINLKDYVNDIDYIYDTNKYISPQAKSDIIRLSLLKNYGGVWADATMLCMQPLDHWIHDAIQPSDLWMYRGTGGGMPYGRGPASWFIITLKEGYMISKWKQECDVFWTNNHYTNNYGWIDYLFSKLYDTDIIFRQLWLNVPYLYCEVDGQSHTLYTHKMNGNTPYIKQLFIEKPPYALKFWKAWNDIYPDVSTEECKQSNGYFAIEMSKRRFCYQHMMR